MLTPNEQRILAQQEKEHYNELFDAREKLTLLRELCAGAIEIIDRQPKPIEAAVVHVVDVPESEG